MPALPATAELRLASTARNAVRRDLAVLAGGRCTRAAGLAAVERLEALSLVDDVPTPVAAQIGHYLAAALAADAELDPGVRIDVLYLLGQIAEASMAPLAGERGAPSGADREHDGAVLACRALLPAILAAAEHVEDDDDEDVRVEAADTAEAAQEGLDAL